MADTLFPKREERVPYGSGTPAKRDRKNKHNSKLTTEDTEDTEKSVSFHKPFQQAVTKERAEAPYPLCRL